MRMLDNDRYASARVYIATPINQCSCNHPHDLHWRYGCGAEDCTCSYEPPSMDLAEAVRILSNSGGAS